jgi:stage V sporulation protein SpoVS
MNEEKDVQNHDENNEMPEYSRGDDNKETPKSLKVKADPPDISADDRKRNVKKLAGAVSHSLRRKGEINIRCFGNAAIGKASKALAIARNYIDVQNLQLECSPAFISTKMGDTELTGISFCTFASDKPDNYEEVDIDKCQSILMVKADAKDVSSDERKRNVKKLAGAIAHALEENKEVVIRCFGNATIGKAAKAIAIARGYTATRGPDLYCWPNFIVAEMNGNERTGICFYCYTNEI